MSSPGCQCAMQNFRHAGKPAGTDHCRARRTTFLSAELTQESFQSNFSLSPLSLLNPLMNHEPTILCELLRDQFRDLCKATLLARGAVAKTVCHRQSNAECNKLRQAGSVLPHKNHWAKHLVFFPKHLQTNKKKKTNPKHAQDIQLRAAPIQWTSSSKHDSALKMGCKTNFWTIFEQSCIRYDKVITFFLVYFYWFEQNSGLEALQFCHCSKTTSNWPESLEQPCKLSTCTAPAQA